MREPEIIPDFVVNLSNENFTEKEMNLLNRGLKFTPKPNKLNVTETVVDIETILKHKLPSTQHTIRSEAKTIISNVIETDKNEQKHNNNYFNTLKSLKEKNCVYTKADKGNKLVIMDKTDYNDRVNELIADCNYKVMNKDLLPSMIRESDKVRQKIGTAFSTRLSRNLIVSNPSIAKIYCLPKIHKIGRKMRPIVSSISTPTYKMAKWLVKEVKQLPSIKSCSVKDTHEFVNKIKSVKLNNNEIMVSFDVVSLFPSIDVDLALLEFENHLTDSEINNTVKNVYIDVAKVCMKQNYFKFGNKCYKVENGTNMGNPLSPLISECFMGALERKLKELNVIPRVWHRYVDDVFAVIEKEKVNDILNVLNSQFPTIKFTCEIENNNELPFLDIKIIKKFDNTLEFAIYHKPTSTMRVITNDSHCSFKTKQAAFHSLAHRLCTIPLSIKHYKDEYDYISNVAKVNGYQQSMVDDIIKKHAKIVNRTNMTTLIPIDDSQKEKQFVSMFYQPTITNKLKNVFNENKMLIVYRNQNKLGDLLGTTKDKTENLKKSGIYRISCDQCEAVYIGQTKRAIETRFKEHCLHIHNKHAYRSAFAAHVLDSGHENVSIDNVELLRSVNDERRLDAYECVAIYKNPNNINLDNGNIMSPLFALTKNLI